MRKKTIRELCRVDVEHYRRQAKTPLVVVLDNVRSLNNIGAIFRTCDAFAVESIAICGISACPPSPEIHKTALGAEDSVQWRYYPNTLQAVQELKNRGYAVCCLEQVHHSVMLHDFSPIPGVPGYALVLGHEVDGVDQAVVDQADICLEIPQHGTKHSLNVSVCAGIAIYEMTGRLRQAAEKG